MAGRSNLKQDLWYCKRVNKYIGIDKVNTFSDIVHDKRSVSTTAGSPEEISVGLIPVYDRYITVYKRNDSYIPSEGDYVFIDIEPYINTNNELLLDDDGIPKTIPDYRVEKLINTKKSRICLIGCSKVKNVE